MMRIWLVGFGFLVAFTSMAAMAASPTQPVPTGAPYLCPGYPEAARQAGIEGDTVLTFRVGVDGMPHKARVNRTSGNVELDQAALACVADWHYRPATENGVAVDASWDAVVSWRIPNMPARPLGPQRCDDVQNTADARRLSGVTVVKMQIGADGSLSNVAVAKSSSDPAMDGLAVACVSEWKYSPARQNGQPVSVPWQTQVAWNAPADMGAPVATAFVPDVVHLEPRIHRLGIDTQMYAQVSAILKLASGGQTWRCRQVFLDISGEHHIRHWIAQGWNDPGDFVYARTENRRYVAVHIRADGTFVAAVDMDDETGMGHSLDASEVTDFLKQEVGVWNASVAEK